MKKITLKLEEIWPILNILNEVCHGIHISNFENSIGEKKETAIDLMNKISKEEEQNNPILFLTDSELNILHNCFEKAFKEIDDWEFQTRIGISTLEARYIKEKLMKFLNK
jgi:hypothetical protein